MNHVIKYALSVTHSCAANKRAMNGALFNSFIFYWLICLSLFLAVLVFAAARGFSLAAVRVFLIAGASLAAKHSL